MRGIDPDGDVLKFGVRAQSGSDVIRVEGISASEANVYLNQELDREVFDWKYFARSCKLIKKFLYYV